MGDVEWDKFHPALCPVHQAVTARKAEERGTSGSLLAKLHYGVVQFLDEALENLQEGDVETVHVCEKFRVREFCQTSFSSCSSLASIQVHSGLPFMIFHFHFFVMRH